MKDWTKEPIPPDIYERCRKYKALRIKTTLEFIAKRPEGATANDFRDQGIIPYGITALLSLKLIVGTQVRELERGSRCFHWLWKIKK